MSVKIIFSFGSIISISLCAIVLGLLTFLWLNRRLLYLARKLPSQNGHLPFFGALGKLIGADGKEFYDLLNSELDGDVSPRTVWLGPILGVVVDNPDHVQKVLSSKSCLNKPFVYQRMGPAKGLVFSTETVWRKNRKLTSPIFSGNQLRCFQDNFNKNALLLVNELNTHLGAKNFNIYNVVAAGTCNNLMGNLFGIDKNFLGENNAQLLDWFYGAFDFYWHRALKLWLNIKPVFWLSKYHGLEKKYVKNGYVKIFEGVLNKYEANYQKKLLSVDDGDEDLNNNNNNNNNGVKHITFVEHLYKKREFFDREELNDQLHALIIGGYETTTVWIANTLLLLAMHPEIQKKVHAEIDREMKTDELTYEDLKNFVYLEQVAKETLRLFPVVPLVARICGEEMELDGFTIPKDACFVIPIMKMFKDPKIWGADVKEFNPDRFAPEKLSSIHPFAFIPFAGGPRKCIADVYSKTAAKTTLAHVLKNYNVYTNLKLHELVFETTAVVKITQGWHVRLEKRCM